MTSKSTGSGTSAKFDGQERFPVPFLPCNTMGLMINFANVGRALLFPGHCQKAAGLSKERPCCIKDVCVLGQHLHNFVCDFVLPNRNALHA